MIRIGFNDSQKIALVDSMRNERGLSKVFTFSPQRLRCEFNRVECETEYHDIIKYKHFYPLLQQVDQNSLVVINECMRSQNRADLAYNCLRHILTQTPHVVVFQKFPIIADPDDLMILVDLGTGSKYRREKWSDEIKQDTDIEATGAYSITRTVVPTSVGTKQEYATYKAKLFGALGSKDPHTLPRQLHAWSSKARLNGVGDKQYLFRSSKHSISGHTYKDCVKGQYDIFEFCHNHMDMADALTVSGMDSVYALTLDLPVDQWYFNRYSEWFDSINAINRELSCQ